MRRLGLPGPGSSHLLIFCHQDRAGFDHRLSGLYIAEHAADVVFLFCLHHQEEAVLSKETVDISYLRPLLKTGINHSLLAGIDFNHGQSDYHCYYPHGKQLSGQFQIFIPLAWLGFARKPLLARKVTDIISVLIISSIVYLD